jgi:hypothetical protein
VGPESDRVSDHVCIDRLREHDVGVCTPQPIRAQRPSEVAARQHASLGDWDSGAAQLLEEVTRVAEYRDERLEAAVTKLRRQQGELSFRPAYGQARVEEQDPLRSHVRRG